jgi:serine/threonine protein kinase
VRHYRLAMREPRRDDPSETFGSYVLYECLGRGGMATVHRAKQTGIEGFERPVALKRMLPWLTSDPEFVKSFVREARLAAMLRHTNIAQTYDLGKVDGVYYIAMELIVGRDLRELLRQAHNTVGPIPVPIAIHILFQICDALDYAHNFRDDQGRALGLVHRDISPANVLIGEDGCAKVVDFGVAKGSTATLHTQSGMLKGKFAYMAPEMLQGVVDARCDLFAVGVVAWELLTAKPLFAGGDDMEILQRVTTWDPPPPSTHNPMVPRELDAWVQMALAKSPARRFQSAAQMRAGLELVARVPSMRATGPDVAAWLHWAFQQKKGQLQPAPAPISAGAPEALKRATGEQAAPRPASDSRPPTVRATPPASLPSMPPVQSPPIAAGGPAQTLLVDDGAVVASQPAPASGERKSTVMFGSGVPVRQTHPSVAPVRTPTNPPPSSGALTPVPSPIAAVPSGPVMAAPSGPVMAAPSGPVTAAPSGPVVAPMPAQASGPYPQPRAAQPHATMIGAVAPVVVGRPSATAPPPPLSPSTVPPSTVPPTAATPQGYPAQPMYTPQGYPAQPGFTPQGYPAQGYPSQGYPAQPSTSQPYPVQVTPHGLAAQPAPTSQPYPAQGLAAQAGSTPSATTVALSDPPAGTPAWAMSPRGDHPLRTPEYMNAAAAYSADLARGTPEPAVAPSPVPGAAPRRAGAGGTVAIIVIGLVAAVGGFFLVQHFL